MLRKYKHFLIISILIFILSCQKEAGEGGEATIFGSIWVKDYNASFTSFNGEYAGADQDVYIIYGDRINGYDDKVSTDYNGNYEFNYLRPGKYQIYVYSKDSTLEAESGEIAILKEIEITDRKEIVEVPTITIYN